MGCGAAEATGLSFVCFVVSNPCVFSANRVFGLFCFINLFPPPPPQELPKAATAANKRVHDSKGWLLDKPTICQNSNDYFCNCKSFTSQLFIVAYFLLKNLISPIRQPCGLVHAHSRNAHVAHPGSCFLLQASSEPHR